MSRRPQYGPRHEAERKRWAAVVKAGDGICCECGRPIDPDARWHLAHDHAIGEDDAYLGPAHVRCNVAERNRRMNPRLARERGRKRAAADGWPEKLTGPSGERWSRVWLRPGWDRGVYE